MGDIERTIRSSLGPDVEEFRYTLHGVIRTGWVHWIDRKASNERPSRRAMNLVARHGSKIRAVGAHFFIGGGRSHVGEDRLAISEPIFALPGISTLDIPEFAEVGGQNAPIWETWDEKEDAFAKLGMTPQAQYLESFGISVEQARRSYLLAPHGRRPWEAVRTALQTFFEEFPFDIVFAAEDNLRAIFQRVPRGADALQIGELLLKVACESADSSAALAGHMTKSGTFELWWD